MVELPGQIEDEIGTTVIVGFGTTVIVVTAVLVQTPILAVTVYVSVKLGVANTVEPLALLKLGEAFHVYEDAPLADKLADEPTQILAEAIVTVKLAGSVIVNVWVMGHGVKHS